MPKLSRFQGQASQMVDIFVQDSSSTTGAGLPGLVYNSAGMTAYYHRNTASSAVAISLVTATLGTFTSGGFIAVDGTHAPGLYQLGIPNAALASGADSVVIYLFGAGNMAPVILEIDLTKYDPLNGNNLGLAYLTQGPMMVKKNQAITAFSFLMFDPSGNPLPGLTVTVTRSLDSGSFSNVNTTGAATEYSSGGGWYYIPFLAGDTNGNCVAVQFSAPGARTRGLTIMTQP